MEAFAQNIRLRLIASWTSTAAGISGGAISLPHSKFLGTNTAYFLVKTENRFENNDLWLLLLTIGDSGIQVPMLSEYKAIQRVCYLDLYARGSKSPPMPCIPDALYRNLHKVQLFISALD
jgi:hypothetical protein